MNGEKKSILTYLSELDFALTQTNQYLSNNPTDDNALSLYNTIVEKYRDLECTYESKFGYKKTPKD